MLAQLAWMGNVDFVKDPFPIGKEKSTATAGQTGNQIVW
jgi:hypothetical protein